MVKLKKKSIKAKTKAKGKKVKPVQSNGKGKSNAPNGATNRVREGKPRRPSAMDLEKAYRRSIQSQMFHGERLDQLLPVKIKGKGLVTRTAPRQQENSATNDLSDGDVSDSDVDSSEAVPKQQEIVTLADLLVKRDAEIKEKQFLIGSSCAAILENPEARIENLGNLVDLVRDINRDGSVNFLAIRKTAMISLVEVFKDIVPEYRIGIVDKEQQTLKKDTLARVNYENKLLSYYKQFLKHLERITEKYTQMLRQSKKLSTDLRQLLETTVQCMCDLVLAHPYFNYSPNIVQVLVIMLNDAKESVRKIVHSCFSTLFKTDARLDLTYHTVRHINMLIKKKERNVFPEMVSCLKYLQIHRINLHEDTLLELKKQKLEKQKSYFINMSRKERKRKKKLQELEKDIFETKAEESKQVVRRKLTDISKMAFMVYFKILKCYPDSRVLSATLEGLAKFAHTINIEFFADLVELLNNLLENASLGYREQLHCIQTVFVILSGQGEALNIDPARFYSHFYKNLLYVNAGKNHEDMESILKTLDIILFKRRRNVTYYRFVGFVKRLATLCLQVLPNGSLGLISLIRSCMNMNQQLDILLDPEAEVGSGKFDPLIEEPEFSNASCTALFETTCLTRHYHQTVRKMTVNVLKGADTISAGRTLTPGEFYTNYDCSEMVFNPEIPQPSKVKYARRNRSLFALTMVQKSFLDNCNPVVPVAVSSADALMFDYYNECVKKQKCQ
ncbi:AGAP010308-PA-like protein [Anopheles sinensis]|uniref:NOC3-like protein n=1 Tax=Anopheles sinensis TaxID=74873 RepID=A0A084W5N4_ANOSI|nr:AGAP010308-PA-like protein [Anopheles sinensis]